MKENKKVNLIMNISITSIYVNGLKRQINRQQLAEKTVKHNPLYNVYNKFSSNTTM